MLSRILLTTVASLAPLSQALTAPDPKYGVVDIQFDMPIDPTDNASATVSITGTIQQAVAKMEADYPGWTNLFLQPDVDEEDDEPVLGKSDNYNCFGRWQKCPWNHINAGQRYLRSLPADKPPKNGAGPGNCGRVSCSYNSAIWWCNDASLSWILIANSARWMNGFDGHDSGPGACTDSSGAQWYSAGQAFYDPGWNVIINADIC
ncbi:hypothetical protein QBC40DRAFT_226243 [Triangularia verruculosa]|uniref:Uncharacterized protein n=1 Tax=Triangularia verruculosa TaxID=2587418 RepID=A0AAN7AUV4_9PEZI|nr:hypothetical protein QBC40DRAFT_226243 [Triangularia verruculosa]